MKEIRDAILAGDTSAAGFAQLHQYDNRHLWMHLKTIVGSHFANYREAWEADRIVAKGFVSPTLSKTYSLEQTGHAAYEVHRNRHRERWEYCVWHRRTASGSATRSCVRATCQRSCAFAALEAFTGS